MIRLPAVFLSCFLLLSPPAAAQQAGTDRGEPLRLYLDCNGFFCDSDYYRTELDFVSHVRAPEDADVHLLITPQPTGGGGTEFTLLVLGRRAFAGMADTLRYVSRQNATEEERRSGLARQIKLGLARYVARTAAAAGMEVSYREPEAAESQSPLRDPWNFWTFRTSLRGNFNGESRFSSRSIFGSQLASRVTEDWKIRLSANANQQRRRFEIDSLTTIRTRQESYNAEGLVARSLGPHWSAGGLASISSSTFLNQDLAVRAAPAIEFSLFPYDEATRRQLTILYSVGVNRFDYDRETIFGVTEQTIADHNLRTSLDLKQRWGSASVSVEGAQFLHDRSRYRLDLFGDMDVRLFRGLSVNVFGNVAYVRDQIHLPAGDATEEEILLRLQELETSYRYFVSVGLSYTFGSIYNNVVNPRFGGTGGRMIFFN